MSNNPLLKYLKIYFANSEILKPYIGFYKPIDSTDKDILIISKKGMCYDTDPSIYAMFNKGNNKFGFGYILNSSLTFQRDTKGEFTGFNIGYYSYKR